MNANANAILTLCSHLCVGDNIKPLEPKEYSALAEKLRSVQKTPSDLMVMSVSDMKNLLEIDTDYAERIVRLIARNASLCFELEQYESMGVRAITRADNEYPSALKSNLKGSRPPIFYVAGNLTLLNRPSIGFVGSRTLEQIDLDFTKKAVDTINSLGYGVVSGGAKGIDTVAGNQSLLNERFTIEYLSDSLKKKLRNSDTVKQIQNGRLLLLSVVNPDAGFNTGVAMMRNRYIYSQAEATIVVRSDLNKGGTWSGAMENLKHDWCPTLCWNHPYPGNLKLIENGALPIGDEWDGKIPQHASAKETPPESEHMEEPKQFSLFETLT